jgi:hypothetical protein
MLELQKILKMKDFFVKIFEISGKKFAFRKNVCIPEKFFFWGGAWNGRGPKFWNIPPTGNRLARPCVYVIQIHVDLHKL